MIKSFKCKKTEKLFYRIVVNNFVEGFERIALMKLVKIDLAKNLNDLRVPISNRLKKMKGDRRGVYSIRINRQWRICFKWIKGHAYNVEIIDYH